MTSALQQINYAQYGIQYAQYGIQESDAPEVAALAKTLDTHSSESVLNFGQEVARHSGKYTDDLLARVRNTDLATAGKKLTQVVQLVQKAGKGGIAHRSRLPVVGRGVDWVRLKVSRALVHVESTQTQMETLLSDVAVIQKGLLDQNTEMEASFQTVREECRLLGIHLAAGKMRLEELNTEIAGVSASAGMGPLESQNLADLRSTASRLDIRLGNLLALQQSAIQTLPQIRVVQAGNVILMEKFHTIQTVTMPAWKRQIMLRVGLNEQRNAVEVADAIDRATNALLSENAKLLRSNAVQSAAANQRLVVDPKTLQAVQDELVATVREVIAVHQNGMAERGKAEQQILVMRESFRKQVGAFRLEAPESKQEPLSVTLVPSDADTRQGSEG